MKFATNSDHRDFFRKNGRIEFEDLADLSTLPLSLIKKNICQRLAVPEQKFDYLPFEKLFSAGRDLWRNEPALKKLVLNPSFAQIVSELVEQKPIRIGYDQFFSKKPPLISSGSDHYEDFISQPRTLEEISSLQGVLGGLFLCLASRKVPEASSFFPAKEGHGVFFKADLPIPFPELANFPESSFLLIAYAKASTVYCMKPTDPLTASLKKAGYEYGDKLTDQLNPVLYR